MRRIEDAPARAVEGGKPRLGHYRNEFKELNLLDADPFGLGITPKALRRFRLKEWQHYAVVTPTHFFGFVIVDAKYFGNAWFYAVDREKNEYFEHPLETPPGAARIGNELWDAECSVERKGFSMRFENRLERGYHRCAIDIAEKKGRPKVEGDLTIHEDLAEVEPLVTLLPFPGGAAFQYSHKIAVPAEGTLRLGGREVLVDRGSAIAILDIHKGYYPYNTWWKWATFAGHDAEGRIVGMNAVNNKIVPPSEWSENCAWIGGKVSLLGPAKFDFDPRNLLGPWRITTQDDRLDATIHPQGKRSGRINLGVVLSDYHQPYGPYAGVLKGEDGREHRVDGFFGVTEDHKARF